MSPFDDHLPCPPLRKWLVPSWEGKAVAAWAQPPQPRWRAPRGLRRLLQRAGVTELDEAEALDEAEQPGLLDVLVVLSPLSSAAPSLPEALFCRLRPGGTLVDLASAPRRAPGELLRPWTHARRLREATALRVRHWLERGAFAPEQWVAVEPADVVVTTVRRAVP